MPGDEWQRFANARAFYGFMWGHPGKKLLFMGQEFGQTSEWNASTNPFPGGCSTIGRIRASRRWIRDLNRLYRETPALYARDCEPDGFPLDRGQRRRAVGAGLSAVSGAQSDPPVAVVCNFTPEPRVGYRLGLPYQGFWREALNSDAGVLRRLQYGQFRRRHGGGAARRTGFPPRRP